MLKIVLMRNSSLKTLTLVICAVLQTTQIFASNSSLFDGYSQVPIKSSHVQGAPKTSSIQASIDGHMLSVVFLENLGSVLVEVTDANGGTVDVVDMYTPNGYTAYIFGTGSYIVNFTLENGDEYYGEFEITD